MFHNTVTINTWGQIIFCGGGHVAHCRTFSSIPVFYPPEALPRCDNQKRFWILPKVPWGAEAEVHPVETYGSRPSRETGRGEKRSVVGSGHWVRTETLAGPPQFPPATFPLPAEAERHTHEEGQEHSVHCEAQSCERPQHNRQGAPSTQNSTWTTSPGHGLYSTNSAPFPLRPIFHTQTHKPLMLMIFCRERDGPSIKLIPRKHIWARGDKDKNISSSTITSASHNLQKDWDAGSHHTWAEVQANFICISKVLHHNSLYLYLIFFAFLYFIPQALSFFLLAFLQLCCFE